MKSKNILLSICLLTIMLATSGQAADNDDLQVLRNTGQAFVQISKKATPAVVFITVEKFVEQRSARGNYNNFFDDEFMERFFGRRFNHPNPPRSQKKEEKSEKRKVPVGQGSGFVISPDGYILTNNHVVAEADTVIVKFSDETGIESKEAKVIGTDPESDIAVIKIDAEDLPCVELGDSDSLEVGEWVLAIGNPFGLTHTVTAGIVSAKGRSGLRLNSYEDFIQTDAAINFGNSGGPLLNIEGKVVGINSAIFSQSGGSMGIGFAIPINMARNVYKQLIEKGSVTRGYLGVIISDLTPELAESFGVKGQKGALVDDVTKDGPAKEAGLEHGDIIIKINDKKIDSASHLQRDIASIAPDTTVKVTVLRDGKEKEFEIKLALRNADLMNGNDSDGGKTARKLGITVQTLTEELAGRLGYEQDSGVVITEIERYSPLALAGVRTGALIREVNGHKVKNTREFWAAVKKAESAVLFYIRQGDYARYVRIKLN